LSLLTPSEVVLLTGYKMPAKQIAFGVFGATWSSLERVFQWAALYVIGATHSASGLTCSRRPPYGFVHGRGNSSV